MKKSTSLVRMIVVFAVIFSSCATTTAQPAIDTDKQIAAAPVAQKPAKKQEPQDPPNIKFAKKLQSELEQQNIKGAIALFAEIPDELKDDIELKLLLGALYYSDSQFKEAITVANEVLAIEETNMDALELISMCNHALGDKKAYQETSNKILEIDPYNVNANIQKAEDLVLNKKYKLARDAYKKALKGDSSNKDAIFGYAQTSYFLDDVKNAEQAFLKILEIDPENAQAYAYLGKLAAETENYVKATKYVQTAIKYAPSNYDYYLDLGNYYRYQGKYDDAIKAWEKATQLDPTYFLAYAYLAGIYDEQNIFDKALENYHMVIETNPKYYYAYEETAILEYHSKNWQNAIDYFAKAAEYSDSYSYKLMMAACYQKLGNKVKTKELLAPLLKTMDRESAEYQLIRFYHDSYSKNAEASLIQKINKVDNSNKRGKMLFYMGLYYELSGADMLAAEYYAKVAEMQAPMFFEYRIAEWGLN